MTITEKIAAENTFLGIEFGSTRIKACLIDDSFSPIAEGTHAWENRLENNIWTYSPDDIRNGLQDCYASLKQDVRARYGIPLTGFAGMGISAMMHGYLAFDKDDRLLVPFRTWRNTCTQDAAEALTSLFDFNIPQRWSIAHLYQAIRNGEAHIPQIAHLNTLAGYVHFLLTGERRLGIGDASGMFPVRDRAYDPKMLQIFGSLTEVRALPWKLHEILPSIALAGECCGTLTAEGAKLLDPAGDLHPGIPFAPPEGDAGTGMTATNAVRPQTGNVSAGTSIFSMLVLDKPLTHCYPEIDIVTTPDGADVAMVHCNNCCGELDAWVRIFCEFAALSGHPTELSEAYRLLYTNARNGDADCGGVTAYNYLSGEPVTGVQAGHPMYFRSAAGSMNLANLLRAELYASMAALKSGMDILFEKENVQAAGFTGHGGLFKVQGIAQQILADALHTDVSVMATAGEGGAWGMALLAAFAVYGNGQPLADWLDHAVFAGMEKSTLSPDADGVKGWEAYMHNYHRGLAAQKALENAVQMPQ